MASIKQLRHKAGRLGQRARALLLFSFVTAIASGMAAEAKAQSFAEWFRQNSTQKKYLLQQIAALQVYAGYLKQGYSVARGGLGSISGSLTAENLLHGSYYNRLAIPGQAVKDNPQVAEILVWQQDILALLASTGQVLGLTQAEKDYLSGVRSAVLKDCDLQLTTLQAIIRDGQAQMSDAERLAGIAGIHSAMQDNYHFAASFSAQVRSYALQRAREHGDALTTRALYNIK
ncbi:hypothetical protein [Mucilaginibacter kameinonensis]|uniref:hypothetical protein n=1 Tax=Mucilaginibacter kameinonensis TaxID=452286 RepID=UPI000EF7F177|nr:hypothetical protein [Mucilaginibacter kameinonensis]